MTIVWGFSIAGCRDFKDCRTPYKSFVVVTFIPINKDDTATPNAAILEVLQQFPANKACELPLEPDAYFTTRHINSPNFSDTLTIYYQKEAVLISHQGGCAYKYRLKKITSTLGGKYKIINKELSTLNDSDIDVQIYL